MATDALDALADLIAASSTFQTWVGASDSTGAKLRVYQDCEEGPEEDEENQNTGFQRPFALIGEATDGFNINMGPFVSGSFLMMFEDDVQSNQVKDHTTVAQSFRSNVYGVIRDMQDAQCSGGHLVVRSIASSETTMRSDFIEGEDDGEPYINRQFTVEYGLL